MPDEGRERLSLADGSGLKVTVVSKEGLGLGWMNAIKTFASCFHAE